MQTHKQVRWILTKCSEETFCVEPVVAKLVFAAPVKGDGKTTMAPSMITPSLQELNRSKEKSSWEINNA